MAFKPIRGFPGYFVSRDGEVRSQRCHGARDKVDTARWKRLRTPPDTKGYPHLSLCRGGKHYSTFLHTILLKTFVGPCPEGYECRHLDGNPANFSLSNLKWDTPKANMADKVRHGTQYVGSKSVRAKIVEADAAAIRALVAGGMTHEDAGRRYGVSKTCVGHIVNRRTWRHVK